MLRTNVFDAMDIRGVPYHSSSSHQKHFFRAISDFDFFIIENSLNLNFLNPMFLSNPIKQLEIRAKTSFTSWFTLSLWLGILAHMSNKSSVLTPTYFAVYNILSHRKPLPKFSQRSMVPKCYIPRYSFTSCFSATVNS